MKEFYFVELYCTSELTNSLLAGKYISSTVQSENIADSSCTPIKCSLE